MAKFSKKAETFYSCTTLSLEVCDKVGYADRVVVFCSDIEALITYVLEARGYDPYNHLVRIGLDGGGGMFKVVINIIDTTGIHATGPFQDTGVRKTIILAALRT